MSIGRHSAGLDPQLLLHPDGPTAEAVLAWVAARDAVLRGLVHALSNRVGTVAAVGGMLDGDPPPPGSVGTAARVLAGEGERLEALLAHFRLATADPAGAEAAPEPVHLAEVLAEAAALAEYGGGEAVQVAVPAGTPPAVVSRAGLVHALLVLARGGRVELTAVAEGARVVVRVAGGAGDDAALAAARWLARVTVLAEDEGTVVVRLPALGAASGSAPGAASGAD